MISIDKEYQALYEIQKSKFYSFAYPVFDVDSVNDILDKVRAEHKTATHVCYAYVLDSPKTEKMSDDGEPGGTAGKPMLELIKKKRLSNVLLIIVRYFGGIKLGAGGLVRAYTNAGNMVLSDAVVREFYEVKKYKAIVPCEIGAKVLNLIQSMGGEIISNIFGEFAEIKFIASDVSKITTLYPETKIAEIGSELRCQ